MAGSLLVPDKRHGSLERPRFPAFSPVWRKRELVCPCGPVSWWSPYSGRSARDRSPGLPACVRHGEASKQADAHGPAFDELLSIGKAWPVLFPAYGPLQEPRVARTLPTDAIYLLRRVAAGPCAGPRLWANVIIHAVAGTITAVLSQAGQIIQRLPGCKANAPALTHAWHSGLP
jgi:hypothetical protein